MLLKLQFSTFTAKINDKRTMLFKIFSAIPIFYLLYICTLENPPTFIDPVNIPIYISGSFGELRSSNFHTGIDIKTNGKTGYDVYAIADGYVSPILVSPFGYGKAIYITHENGYTSVYSHLESFGIQIEDYVKNKQYINQSFYLNTFPDSDLIKVKQGDVIAYTGNSGSSMGPHLHFEVRNSVTQEPIDPMLFNFNIKDTIAPIFYNLYVYQIDNNANFHRSTYPTSKQKSNYTIKNNDTILTYGTIGLAVHINDQINGSKNNCGITNLQVCADSSTIYNLNLSKISFNEVKYVQAHSDYWLNKNNHRRIHKCFVEPGNRFSNYSKLANNGYINIQDQTIRDITITGIDSYNNISKLSFVLKADISKKVDSKPPKYLKKWLPNKINEYNDSLIKISTNESSLYDTLFFDYQTLSKTPNTLTRRYKIGDENTPIHNQISVILKYESIPDHLSDKIVTAEVSTKKINVHERNPNVKKN